MSVRAAQEAKDRKDFEQISQDLKQQISGIPDLAPMANSLLVDSTPEGVRIQIMDQDKTIHATAKNDIPIGHKLAIKSLASGDTVIKYGVDIGRTIAPIAVGEHLHVHNVKTKRW